MLDNILGFSPSPPVGQPPIRESLLHRARTLSEAPLKNWAFVTLPTWVAEIADTYSKVKADALIYLDVCSAKPIYIQRVRAHEYDRDGERARELARGMFAKETINNLPDDLRPLAKAVSKDKRSRALLNTAIQTTLYGITPREWGSRENGFGDDFRITLANTLADQRKVIEQPGKWGEKGLVTVENIYDNPEIGMNLRFDEMGNDSDPSYFQIVGSLKIPSRLAEFAGLIFKLTSTARPTEDDAKLAKDRVEAGSELAARYINWQANYLVDIIAGNRRYLPFRAVSMDLAPVDDLAISAIMNTPDDEQNMNLHTDSITSLDNPNLHLTGSTFESLPFPDDSLAFITCFDGWPNHFQLPPGQEWSAEAFEEVAVKIISGFYQKLAYGGKIVIFPWDISGLNQTKKDVLVEIRKRLQHELDVVISIESMSRKTLKSRMSDSDLRVADTKSTLTKFDQDRYGDYPAFIIKKPKKSSIMRRSRRERRREGELANLKIRASKVPSSDDA